MKCCLWYRKKLLVEYDPDRKPNEIDFLKIQFSQFENDIKYKQRMILSQLTHLTNQNNSITDQYRKIEFHINHQYEKINHLQEYIKLLQENNTILQKELYKLNGGVVFSNLETKLNTINETSDKSI
jgi:hypothetical protein